VQAGQLPPEPGSSPWELVEARKAALALSLAAKPWTAAPAVSAGEEARGPPLLLLLLVSSFAAEPIRSFPGVADADADGAGLPSGPNGTLGVGRETGQAAAAAGREAAWTRPSTSQRCPRRRVVLPDAPRAPETPPWVAAAQAAGARPYAVAQLSKLQRAVKSRRSECSSGGALPHAQVGALRRG